MKLKTDLEGASSEAGQRTRFLLYTAIALLIFSVAAFSLKALIHPERLVRYTPPVMLHAGLMIGWFSLFVLQAWLAGRRAIALHMKIGAAAVLLVVVLIAVSFSVSYALSREFGVAFVLAVNSMMLFNFAVLFAAAIIAAKRGFIETHKRLILIASLNFMGPPIVRIFNIFGIPDMAMLPATAVVIVLIPLAYDYAVRGKPHTATLAGSGFSVIMTAITMAAVSSPLIGSF